MDVFVVFVAALPEDPAQHLTAAWPKQLSQRSPSSEARNLFWAWSGAFFQESLAELCSE